MTATKTRKPRTKKALPNAAEATDNTAAPTPAKTGRGRRKAKETQEQPARSPLEQEICDKYPTHNIEVGSLMLADHPDNPFPGKRVVSFICPCGTSRMLATSDLHHVHHCRICIVEVRKNRRRTAAEKKAQ